MFLVQMALDTKRSEVQKLEQKAHQREEALKRSELLLEEVGAGMCAPCCVLCVLCVLCIVYACISARTGHCIRTQAPHMNAGTAYECSHRLTLHCTALHCTVPD